MTYRISARSKEIRDFILNQVFKSASQVPLVTAKEFGISRQAAQRHLRKLCNEGLLTHEGRGPSSRYRLSTTNRLHQNYAIVPGLSEDVVWTNEIKELFDPLKDNVQEICFYGFTEIFNNAIDHSEGTRIMVTVTQTAISSEIWISDDGLGIFNKLHRDLELLDRRHAVLELAKGKLTTDPARHTGEGIFFTSRMFDKFAILSGDIYFSHEIGDPRDWILEVNGNNSNTNVVMRVHHGTDRRTLDIFDAYADQDYRFTKTVVPVRLVRYEQDQLVSRSQAKRLLARVERFKTVLFDFTDVESIGHSFADEIFRVFALAHPDIELAPIHANTRISLMINRVRSGLQA